MPQLGTFNGQLPHIWMVSFHNSGIIKQEEKIMAVMFTSGYQLVVTSDLGFSNGQFIILNV